MKRSCFLRSLCVLALLLSLCGAACAQGAVTILPQTTLLFGVDKPTVEAQLGGESALVGEGLSEYGYPTAVYRLQACWFGWQPLDTDFVYRKLEEDELMLERVLIRTAPLGLTDDALAQRLTDAVGQPQRFDDVSCLWGSDSMAQNPSLRQYILVQEAGETCVEVLSYIHHDVGEVLQCYDRTQDERTAAGDAADRALLAAVRRILPPDDPYVQHILSWTDGYGYVLGSCTADDVTRSDSFSIRMDKNDFFAADGTALNEEKFVSTLVHEYGHALTLNASQLDLSRMADTVSYRDLSLYREDSLMKAFYDRFYADGRQRDHAAHPEDYVSEYAGTAGIHEDIADTFKHFVLQPRPTGGSIAEQKIAFFYEYASMVAVRSSLRDGLGL